MQYRCRQPIEWKMMASVPVPTELMESKVDTTDIAVAKPETEATVVATLAKEKKKAKLQIDS